MLKKFVPNANKKPKRQKTRNDEADGYEKKSFDWALTHWSLLVASGNIQKILTNQLSSWSPKTNFASYIDVKKAHS